MKDYLILIHSGSHKNVWIKISSIDVIHQHASYNSGCSLLVSGKWIYVEEPIDIVMGLIGGAKK
jgi:hypothetical protein